MLSGPTLSLYRRAELTAAEKEDKQGAGGAEGGGLMRGLDPRNVVDVRGLSLRVEGLKKGRRFFAFALENAEGEPLLRLSANGAAEGKQWVAALCLAGAKVATEPRGHEGGGSSSSPARGGAAATLGSRLSLEGAAPALGALRRVQSTAFGGSDGDAGGAAGAASSGGGAGRRLASLRRLPTLFVRARRGLSPAAQRRERAIRRRAAFPTHRRQKFSLLSSEQIEVARHAGLLNLFVVIIVATNFRLVVENILKYGILIKMQVVRLRLEDWPLVMPGLASLAAFTVAAWAIERAVLAKALSPTGAGLAHTSVVAGALAVPAVAIQVADSDIVPGFLLMAAAVATAMKLLSYAHVNYDLRRLSAQKAHKRQGGVAGRPDGGGAGSEGVGEDASPPTTPRGAGAGAASVGAAGAGKSPDVGIIDSPDFVAQQADTFDRMYSVAYPANLTLLNLCYFMAAPTLCYQPSYPRSAGAPRRSWLFRRMLELAVCAAFLMLVIEQYIFPAVENTLKLDVERGLAGITPARAIERVLKLSLPVLYCWLCVFFGFFHVLLNIQAELLRFADREFYSDWWNANTLSQYWRRWNLPVHHWATRHVYFPLLEAGAGKGGAMVGVFLLSATLHELLIGVPCHVLRFWAFGGMLAQAPLVWLTGALHKRFKNSSAGNYIFWLTFCFFGQPMILLLYWHDVLLQQRAKEAAAAGM